MSDFVSPLEYYHGLINTGVLRGDDHQTRIIQKLQDLHDKLTTYTPPSVPDPSASTSLVCPTSPLYKLHHNPYHTDISLVFSQ